MPIHTDKHYEEELQELKEKILLMGGAVEEMIARAVKGLTERDSNTARDVIKGDRPVNQLEMEIDDLCVRLLALRQPAASDLRFITIGLKINKDLERIGDLAVNICEEALEINKEPPLKPYIDLPKMAQKASEMLHRALDAFVARDPLAARQVCEEDDVVDDFKDKIQQELIGLMEKNPLAVSRGMRLVVVVRHLERIADHATNIAEEVIFMVRGQDIRHGGKM